MASMRRAILIATVAGFCLLITAASYAVELKIALRWKDNSANESGFIIEKRKGKIGAFAEYARVPAGTTDADVIVNEPNVIFCFRVRAYNPAGGSKPTNIKCVRAQVL